MDDRPSRIEYQAGTSLMHQPILPSRNYRRGRPGPLRAVYNNEDRTEIMMVYHNPNISAHWGENYDRMVYIPAGYVDTDAPETESHVVQHSGSHPGRCARQPQVSPPRLSNVQE
ncbi:putative ribonuclease/ribotoxin [Septoria linicola]|nr:putative ribonuclease/ribotoxin [Septoria linicola]